MATAAQKRDYLRDHRGEFGSVAQGIEIMNLAPSSYYEIRNTPRITSKIAAAEVYRFRKTVTVDGFVMGAQ